MRKELDIGLRKARIEKWLHIFQPACTAGLACCRVTCPAAPSPLHPNGLWIPPCSCLRSYQNQTYRFRTDRSRLPPSNLRKRTKKKRESLKELLHYVASTVGMKGKCEAYTARACASDASVFIMRVNWKAASAIQVVCNCPSLSDEWSCELVNSVNMSVIMPVWAQLCVCMCVCVCVCVLPSGSWGELPQPSLMTMGAKARRPSTLCFLMLSRMLRGKWMCRSHRNTMLWLSCRRKHTRMYTFIACLKKKIKKNLLIFPVSRGKSVWMFRLRSLCMSWSRFVRTPADVHTRLIRALKD